MTEPVPAPRTDLAHPVVTVGAEPTFLAAEVEAVVLALPGVARLHGGRFGGLGTYLPGRRVTGIRIDEDGTEVHIVSAGTEPVPVTAGRVQRAVSAIAPMPVHVHVEDIDVPFV